MNEKNEFKRRHVTVDRKWHRRLKMLSVSSGQKLEHLVDEAIAAYLAEMPTFQKKAP